MKSISIILADDDRDDRDLFEEAAASAGASAKLASNGTELMQMLATGSLPDLIFLDLNMPEKSGKECLQEIRANDVYRYIPVIIYSTSSSRKDIDDTRALGANLYLVKPNSFGSLKAAMKAIVEKDWTQTGDFLYPA
jgi:CheY-like chemotaxis protein